MDNTYNSNEGCTDTQCDEESSEGSSPDLKSHSLDQSLLNVQLRVLLGDIFR